MGLSSHIQRVQSCWFKCNPVFPLPIYPLHTQMLTSVFRPFIGGLVYSHDLHFPPASHWQCSYEHLQGWDEAGLVNRKDLIIFDISYGRTRKDYVVMCVCFVRRAFELPSWGKNDWRNWQLIPFHLNGWKSQESKSPRLGRCSCCVGVVF